MSQRQCGRGEDRGRWTGITLTGQNVEDNVGRMNAVGDRLGACDFDRGQSVDEHRGKNVDHLPIAVMGASELAPHTFHRGRQHPIFEGSAVAQGAGLAGEYGHVMPGVEHRLATPERARMLGDDPTVLTDHDAVGIHRTAAEVTCFPGRPTLMAKPRETKRTSDDVLVARTGKPWAEWFKILDNAGATKWTHKEIFQYLYGRKKVPGWWSQMVAVGYEHERGMRGKLQKCDGEFSSGASRTLNVPMAKAYDAWVNEKARTRWLPGAEMEITTATPGKSIRAKWNGGKSRLKLASQRRTSATRSGRRLNWRVREPG